MSVEEYFCLMINTFAIIMLMLLAACAGSGGILQPVDNRAFLNSLAGPKVPSIQDTEIELAKNFEKQGDFLAAAQQYQSMLQKKPEDKTLMLSLADALRRQGDNDKAISVYDALLQKDPASAAAKEGKGLALISKGDFEASIPLLEEVVKNDPTRWKTLNALGILFTMRNMHPEAGQYYREALKQSPSNISVMNNMGLSQALDGKFDVAISSLQQASTFALAGSSERKRIDLNLALVYATAGRPDNANTIAEQYLSGAALDNNRGLYAHLAKDDALAKTYLNMALSQSKSFYEKAWDNLQSINTGNNSDTPEKPKTAPKTKHFLTVPKPATSEKKAEEKKAMPEKTEETVDKKIINILNDSGEKQGD